MGLRLGWASRMRSARPPAAQRSWCCIEARTGPWRLNSSGRPQQDPTAVGPQDSIPNDTSGTPSKSAKRAPYDTPSDTTQRILQGGAPDTLQGAPQGGPSRRPPSAASLALGLDPEQQRAVETEALHVRVKGGPGSGKTRAVVARALHLVTGPQQVHPRSMAVITFTNKLLHGALEAMEGRMVQRLNEQGQRTKDMVEAEVALLLPQIAILLRQELDATYALAPPQWQQEAQGLACGVARAFSAVGRMCASVWRDPFFGDGLRVGLAAIWICAFSALAINIFLWIFKLFGIVPEIFKAMAA